MRFILPLISLIAILFSSIPVFADNPSPSNPIEVQSLRTETSKTYDEGIVSKGYRKYVYVGSLQPVHYKDNYNDSREIWKNINPIWNGNTVYGTPYILVAYPDTKSIMVIDKKSGDSVTLQIDNGSSKFDIKSSITLNGNGFSAELPHGAKVSVIKNKPVTSISIREQSDADKLLPKTQQKGFVNIDNTNSTVFSYTASSTLDLIVGAANCNTMVASITGTWTIYNEAYVNIGYYSTDYKREGFGARFTNVTVPNAAVISNSYLTITIMTQYTGTVARAKIVGDNEDNAAVFGTLADYQSRRGTDVGGANNNLRTTAEVAWSSIAGDVANTAQNTPDISTVITEITSRAGWSSGNAMVLFCDDHADQSDHNNYAIRQYYSYSGSTTKCPKLHIEYTVATAPSVSTLAATSVEDTTATLTGNITALGSVANANARGFEWGTTSNVTLPISTQQPRTTPYSANWTEFGSFGVGTFTNAITGLTAGTTYYVRAYAHDAMSANYTAGWGYGTEANFLTKPAAPTNIAATDGTDTAKVVVTWTKSTGATGYHIYRDGAEIAGSPVGDVATVDDTNADPPTITPGVATACDGCSALHVTLSVAGDVANHGTTHTYKVVAQNATGHSDDSLTDTGYRDAAALGYTWYRSAADADAAYASIAGEGGTTDPYNDINAPADGSGRWYYCHLTSTDAVAVDTNHDRGNRSAVIVTTLAASGTTKTTAIVNGYITDDGGVPLLTKGFDYGTTIAVASHVEAPANLHTGNSFSYTLTGLTPASVYYFRAEAGGVDAANMLTFATTGSPNLWEAFTTTCNWTSINTYSSNVTFQTFTSDAVAHTITYVKLHLRRVGSPGYVYASIRYADAGSTEPTGLDISSAVLNGNAFSTSYTWYTFVLTTPISIEAGRPYAIVLTAPSGDDTNYVQWCGNSAGGEADGRAGHTHDGSMTWTSDSPVDLLFEIWGYASLIVTNPNVFTNYLETGDWLVTCLVTNTYAPYYNNKADPAAYFYLQLIDAATNQIKASTPIRYWNRQPMGLYLRASETTSLTWQGNYYVRVQYQHDASIYQEVAIAAIDWRGNNLVYLDQWIRVTAADLEEYYAVYDANTQITTNADYLIDSDKGTVLNIDGGVMYARSIPALTRVRPTMFDSVQSVMAYTMQVYTGAGVPAAGDWKNRVGSRGVAIFDIGAAALGMDSSKVLAGGMLVAIYIIIIGFVGLGNPFTGMALGLPILFGCYVFDIMWTGFFFVIVFIMIALGVIKLASSVGSG